MKRGLLILPLAVLMISALGGCDDSGSSSASLDLHAYTVPIALVYDGVEYVCDSFSEYVPTSEIGDFIGYWINAEDLEKWQEYDGDEDIVYVVQEDNILHHFSYTGELSDRFELYWTVNEGEIAVHVWPEDFLSYQRVSQDS